MTRRGRLLVAVLALIATYAFFSDYLPPFKKVRLWSDAASYHYSLQRYAFQSLKQGRVPLWDPSIYSGIPYAGNVQAALFYPPTWLMYAASWRLPRISFKAFEGFTFLHVWLAFFLCFLWLRGRGSTLAALLGAAVFSFTGYLVYQLVHTGVIATMAWLPLGLWGVDEAVSRRHWRPLWKVAAASALAFLAGYPAAWIVNCITIVAYALASPGHWRAAAGAGGAILASIPLFFAQLLPAWEARSLMVLEPKYGSGAYGPVTLLLSYFVPNWFDFNPGHTSEFDPGCMYLYLGLPALFAILWAIRRHQVRLYIQALVVMAVLLLLANPPWLLIRTIQRIPALLCTMQPFNFYAGISAMAALVSAIALNDFLSRPMKFQAPVWLLAGCAGVLLLWAFRDLRIWRHGAQFATGSPALWHAAIGLVLFASGLWCVRQTSGRLRIAMAAVLLLATGIDYKVFGSSRLFNAWPGDLDKEHARYGIRGVDDTAFRAMWTNRHYRVVPDSLAAPDPVEYRMWGLATPEGFDPFLPEQYKQAILRWVPFQTNRLFYTDLQNRDMMQTLGVRYVLVRDGAAHDPELAHHPDFRLLGRQDIFCHVYEYLRAQPPYRWEGQGTGSVTLTGSIPERRDFLVRSADAGRFVLVEQYYPGWHATVDGQPAAIQRWRGAFQSVAVPAGEHRIRFEYSPASVRNGAAVSLVAFVGLLALLRSKTKTV